MTEESKPRVPTDKLVKAYLKMTASLAEKRRAYEAEEKVLKDKMAKVKSALLAYCKEENLHSVKNFRGFVLPHSKAELLDKRLGVYGEVCG
jgi:predicted YcjX-like family ATPase